MKKLFMWIAIAMVAVIVLSTFSHLFEPLKDNSGDSSSTVATTVEPIEEYQEGVFYYLDEANNLLQARYFNLGIVPDGSRGFFIKNDTIYFAKFQIYDGEFATYLFEDGLPTYGEYTFTRAYTTNMMDISSIDGDSMESNFLTTCLIIYAEKYYTAISVEELINLHDNVNVPIGHHDPSEVEGPSAG